LTEPSNTPLADFIDQLLQEGRAIVRDSLHRQAPSDADRQRTATLLEVAHRHAADDAPRTPPDWDAAAAVWSADALAWAAGMLVDRGEVDVAIPKRITSCQPSPRSPSVHWSVDLLFRLAADLFHRGKKICDGDPLDHELQMLFSPWPLACVGTTIESPAKNLSVVLGQECLSAIYVDRVLLRQDSTRAAADPLPELIQRVVGAYDAELGIPVRNQA
jgi:hypothetical protein